MTSRYTITAYWGPRRETAGECGGRYRRMLDALAPIDPAFGRWTFAGRKKGTTLDQIQGDELPRLIADCVARADDGDPIPVYGYRFGAYAGSRATSLLIRVHAGEYAPATGYFANTVILETAPLSEANASLVSLTVFKQAMLAIASAWDATWCAAYPDDLMPLWTKPVPWRPQFDMAWMAYLSARFASMVPPLRSAIVEYPQGGGILMIATEDRFDTANPAHLAAREIETALAPVNALPWPPDAEPQFPGE